MLHGPLPTLLLTFALGLLSACSTPEERAADHAAKALEFHAAGDHRRARLEAQNALQVAPKNVPARYLLAELAEQDGEVGQMMGHLEVVIAEDPRHVPARVKLATVLVFAQEYDGARLLMEQLNRLAPRDPSVRLLQARLHLRDNRTEEAIRALDEVLAAQPGNAEAALMRGMAYAAADPEQGLADLATSIGHLDKAAARPLREARIRILESQRRSAEVEAELKALVADYPGGGYARDLADHYTAMNRLEDAEAVLVAALGAHPDDVGLRFALAQVQSRLRQEPGLAEATLKQLVAAAPGDQRAAVLLGGLYEASGRTGEAIAQYQGVIRLNPDSPAGQDAWLRLAALQQAAGRRAEARQAYDAILAHVPDHVQALTARGRLNVEEGRLEDALADLRGALRKDPDNQAALRALARAHEARSDLPMAEDAYRRLDISTMKVSSR